jgi:uncharacterized protein
MKKIILDTNVIISAILKGKNAYSIIDFAVSGNALICLSDDVEKEYYNVVSYKKFQQIPGFLEDANSILQLLSSFSIHYNPFTKFNLIKDFPDNRFLELAAISSANYLITGNTKDFDFPSFFETKIISPAQFCEEFNL